METPQAAPQNRDDVPQQRPVHHPRFPQQPPRSFLEVATEELFGSTDAKWGPFRPWVRARKLAGTWREWDLRAVKDAEPTEEQDKQWDQRPSRRNRRFTFETELRDDVRPSHADFEELLGRDTHPADYDDVFFEIHWRNLYVKTVEFATKWFDGDVSFAQLNDAGYIWDSNMTPQFIEYTRLVAHEDRTLGGWPVILNDPRQRKWLIVGILSQIMEKKIFNELLFGADEFTAMELAKSDATWIEKEGYDRKLTRSIIVRWGLDGGILPAAFWGDVDELAAKSAKIFMPLLNVMKELNPQAKSGSYALDVFLQDLHYLLSYAGFIQVCTAVSPSIYHFLSATPGARMDWSIESQSDNVIYRESKAFHDAREKIWTEGIGDTMRTGDYGNLPPDTQIPRTAEELRTLRSKRTRGAKVKFAVFPKLTRYTAENKDEGTGLLDPRNELGQEDAGWDEQQRDRVEGQSIVDISSCMVVYYQGLIDPPANYVEAYPLEYHIKTMGDTPNGLFWLLVRFQSTVFKWLYAQLWRLIGLVPFFLALDSLYIGWNSKLDFIKDHYLVVFLILALLSWPSKYLIDRDNVTLGVSAFFAPLLLVGVAGVVAGSDAADYQYNFIVEILRFLAITIPVAVFVYAKSIIANF